MTDKNKKEYNDLLELLKYKDNYVSIDVKDSKGNPYPWDYRGWTFANYSL